MTTKNGDMPAMPTQYNGGDIYGGLTKREMMTMHVCAEISGSIDSEECYQRMKAVATNCGISVSQWIARDAVKQADALLAELEQTK